MGIDYASIKKVIGIEAKATEGQGMPLVSLILTYLNQSGNMQEHFIPAPAKIAYEVVGELYRRKLILESEYHRTQKEIDVLDLPQ